MPGADASQYTRYLRNAAIANASVFENTRSDRSRLRVHVTRETGVNQLGLSQFLPSLVKQPEPTIIVSETIKKPTVTGGGPGTVLFTFTVDGGGPVTVPSIILDGGGP